MVSLVLPREMKRDDKDVEIYGFIYNMKKYTMKSVFIVNRGRESRDLTQNLREIGYRWEREYLG